MRLAVSGEPTDETLAFGRQIGATEFVGGPGLPIERGYYRYQDLMLLRNRVQDAGLRYEVTSMPEEWTLQDQAGASRPRRANRQLAPIDREHGGRGFQSYCLLLLASQQYWPLRP